MSQTFQFCCYQLISCVQYGRKPLTVVLCCFLISNASATAFSTHLFLLTGPSLWVLWILYLFIKVFNISSRVFFYFFKLRQTRLIYYGLRALSPSWCYFLWFIKFYFPKNIVYWMLVCVRVLSTGIEKFYFSLQVSLKHQEFILMVLLEFWLTNLTLHVYYYFIFWL